MEIAVIGAGHVGLVCAACLAGIGHRVRVQDIDGDRVEELARGETPFLEPGLDELLGEGRKSGRLSFHTDPADALPDAKLIFICVPTWTNGDTADLSAVVAAASAVAKHAADDAVLVNRSTSPVGTLEYIRTLVEEERGSALDVVSNPEFLAEGTAVADFLAPYRIVIGAWEEWAVERLVEAYRPILDGLLPEPTRRWVKGREATRTIPVPLLITAPETAELTKYAANAFLAVKISFINEMATIADRFGADVDEVSTALGLDPRIGPHFLAAGLGWGGSCFPKDILVLKGMAETSGVSARILSAANEVNTDQRRWVVHKLRSNLKTLLGRRVALLGLSFKPNTDDIRNAPALEIADDLVRLNVHVRAFDPAVTRLPAPLDGSVEIAADPIAAATGADALVVATEWPQFADLPLAELRAVMRVPLLIDGRNCIDPDRARAAGFIYVGVGRGGGDVLPINGRASGAATGESRQDPASLTPMHPAMPAGRPTTDPAGAGR